MSAALLEYPLGPSPAVGSVTPVVAGLSCVRLPVPGALRYINVWLLDDGDGFTLVDTGMNVPAARAVWDDAGARALCGRPIRRIVCTHHHPDHAGLAGWLAERYGATLYMSAAEERLMRTMMPTWPDPATVAARLAAFERDGLTATEETRSVLAGDSYRSVLSGIPTDIRRLADSDRVEIGAIAWDVLELGGHTDGQLLLHATAPGLLIAGDQLLPRITSNVGVYPERSDRDPLDSFLASFDRLERLDPEPLVLPSHGDVFRGARRRIAVLRAHHAAVLETVVGLVREPATAAEIAARLFRTPLDPLNRMLAVGETLAHLCYLARRGRLRIVAEPGAMRRFGLPSAV